MGFDFSTIGEPSTEEGFDFSTVEQTTLSEDASVETETPESNYPSDIEHLTGMGEVALTMGTGAIASIVGGAGALANSISGYIKGDDDYISKAEDQLNLVTKSLTYSPRTQEGKDMLRMLGIPFQKFEEFTDSQGTKVLDATGSPEAATLMKTLLASSPDMLGLKGSKLKMRKFNEIKGLESEAKGIGLELKASPDVQKGQIIDQAVKESGGKVTKGSDMAEIQFLVQEAKKSSKAHVNELYESARNTVAGVPSQEIRIFNSRLKETLNEWDMSEMNYVQKRLSELDSIDKYPDGSYVKLKSMDDFRKKLNPKKVVATDTPQQAVMGIIKGKLDEFLDAQFNADMIKGTPEALNKWKKARSAAHEHFKTFKDDKVIKQLAEQNATPEVVRSWVFGTSKLGYGKQAGGVISGIKKIIGEDSPQFSALRQDALLNILDPLLKETPNFNQFARAYDDLIKNNPTLVTELFPDSATSLKELRKFSLAVERNKAVPMGIKIEETISRALVGHQIAKATIRVTLLGQILKFLRRQGSKTQRSRVLGEILGYDPDAPLIPISPALIGGAVKTMSEEESQ